MEGRQLLVTVVDELVPYQNPCNVVGYLLQCEIPWPYFPRSTTYSPSAVRAPPRNSSEWDLYQIGLLMSHQSLPGLRFLIWVIL